MNMNVEIREAIESGARALNSLRQAQEHLEGARGWGMLDMVGGGFLSTMLKQNKMEKAQSCIQQAQDDLRCFSRELQDVDMPSVELGGFITFADYFFDGFLADFMVQQKINQAREQVAQAIDRVEAILRELRAMQRD